MIIVEPCPPHQPDVAALLQASHALMNELFPPDENFALDIDALDQPHIEFYIARQGDQVIGTAALAKMVGYGELKSMFVDGAARGAGAAKALLRQIEDAARGADLPLLRLETGEALEAACAMYRRNGFKDCGPFGDYTENKSSIFMEKEL